MIGIFPKKHSLYPRKYSQEFNILSQGRVKSLSDRASLNHHSQDIPNLSQKDSTPSNGPLFAQNSLSSQPPPHSSSAYRPQSSLHPSHKPHQLHNPPHSSTSTKPTLTKDNQPPLHRSHSALPPSHTPFTSHPSLPPPLSSPSLCSLSSILSSPVSFSGRNIEIETRRLINLARVVLKQPKVLIVWEEGLCFGEGTKHNTFQLISLLPACTLLTSSKSALLLGLYDRGVEVQPSGGVVTI